MKLWVDDERPAPDGWTWVRTGQEAIDALELGLCTYLALDHDLGDESELTGYDVACWVERRFYEDTTYLPPIMSCHSDNPVGRKRIQQIISKLAIDELSRTGV